MTQLQHSFQNVLTIPPITPQRTIFGSTYHLINHILLIFKYYVYKTRESPQSLKRNIQQISLKNENIFNKNGNNFQKTNSTYFEIHGGATVGLERGNVFFFFFFLPYIVIFYTSCGIISALKADLVRGLFKIVETS